MQNCAIGQISFSDAFAGNHTRMLSPRARLLDPTKTIPYPVTGKGISVCHHSIGVLIVHSTETANRLVMPEVGE